MDLHRLHDLMLEGQRILDGRCSKRVEVPGRPLCALVAGHLGGCVSAIGVRAESHDDEKVVWSRALRHAAKVADGDLKLQGDGASDYMRGRQQASQEVLKLLLTIDTLLDSAEHD